MTGIIRRKRRSQIRRKAREKKARIALIQEALRKHKQDTDAAQFGGGQQ